MTTTDKSPSRKGRSTGTASDDTAFVWSPGLVLERPALLFSDGGLGLVCIGSAEENLRDELREQNRLETDPAHMTRFGVVRIEVMSVEDHRPPAPPDVRDLLQRCRALPRLTASLKDEIDAVLARVEG